jgi:enamine deaminase RidA (YjgF/YER057c/UK114 family)
MSAVADRLAAMGIVLPKPAAPVANYVGAVRAGSLVVVSGQLPFGPDGKLDAAHTGKLKAGAPIDAAKAAARLAAINVLAQVQAAVGDLDKVTRVIRLGGFFSVEGGHEALPAAMNGASDLIGEAFGDKGRHARTTVGVAHLPLDAVCEVEGMFEIAP